MPPRHPPRDVLVLVLRGRLGCERLPELTRALGESLLRGDACVVVCDVGEVVDPDLATVDALARLALTTRRLGRRFRLRGPSRHLRQLLRLCGLDTLWLETGRSWTAPSVRCQAAGSR